MISVSRIESCLRMPNISSCLRMVLAFSTSSSSAKDTSSAGVLALRSWSFISRIRGSPMEGIGDLKKRPIGTEGGSQVCTRRGALGPYATAGPKLGPGTRMHLPAFGEIDETYEKTVPYARGRRAIWIDPWGLLSRTFVPPRESPRAQNGFTTTRIT